MNNRDTDKGILLIYFSYLVINHNKNLGHGGKPGQAARSVGRPKNSTSITNPVTSSNISQVKSVYSDYIIQFFITNFTLIDL